MLNSVFVLDNPFYKNVVELPFATSDKTLMDFCDLSYFKDIRHPEYNRFIHIDAAYSTNTLDVYGLAAGYCVEKDVVEFSNEAIQNPEDDIFSKKDREYFVDFAVGITAPHGQEVNLTKVQDFIEYLIRNCNYPVACITADQFQSKQTLQNLQNKGFNTDYVSVDRSRDPYLFLRYLVHNRQILISKNDYLRDELKKIRDDGKRCDHPVGSHKDVADAVAGAIWKCANSTDIINKGHVVSAVLNKDDFLMEFSPNAIVRNEQSMSLEMDDFERLKEQFSNGIFKGL